MARSPHTGTANGTGAATRARRTSSRLATEAALRGYRWMLLARHLDDEMWSLRRQGKGHFAVSCAGHEAIGAAAGLAANLETDFLAAHYRDLSACIAWGMTARDAAAHYFGRAADPCTGGRQPYAHWGSREHRIVSMQGPQPNQVTHGVGIGYGIKLQGESGVVWISFGDGGAQKGEVHEAMNFAGVHRLPVVFCVETNGYTQSVPISLESSVSDLSLRAQGYGMPGVSVDGMDLEAVYAAAREAIDRARSGRGPSLIEARAYRYRPNTSNDDDSRYRSREEVEEWRKRDPLALTRRDLLEQHGVSADELDALEAGVGREAVGALAWAEGCADGEPETSLLHTWHELAVRGV